MPRKFGGTGPKPKFKQVYKKPKHPGMGRKPKVVDWSLVRRLAKIHCTASEIGSMVGLSARALSSRPEFPRIYKNGWDSGSMSLRRMQWMTAEKGNMVMQIFLGKQMLGQSDKVWMSTPPGEPIELSMKPDLKKLSVDELCVLRALLEKAQVQVKQEQDSKKA